jgi:hypothetical protein
MANITFEMPIATTTMAVTIPRWAPDIKWMQTTSAIVIKYPSTTWKAEADDDQIRLVRRDVISWTARTVTAYWDIPLKSIVNLKYRAVGELTR